MQNLSFKLAIFYKQINSDRKEQANELHKESTTISLFYIVYCPSYSRRLLPTKYSFQITTPLNYYNDKSDQQELQNLLGTSKTC